MCLSGTREKANRRSRQDGNQARFLVGARLGNHCCLLFALASSGSEATTTFQEALACPKAMKTYIAIVRGEGILHGHDLKQDGWFKISRPIKNERGTLSQKNATTWFRFVAGQSNIHNPG